MRRREFVTAAGVVLIAGCSNDSSETPEETESGQTPEETEQTENPTDTLTEMPTESMYDTVVSTEISEPDPEDVECGGDNTDCDFLIDDGEKIVLVELSVDRGELDIMDLDQGLKLETERRLYDMNTTLSPTLPNGYSRGVTVKEGVDVDVMFTVPGDVEEYSLRMEEPYDDVGITGQD